METKSTKMPRDFFLYLLSSATLYYSAVWLITLWYQYINHWYPDPNQYAGADIGISSLMRWALASLIIVFPVYIGVTMFLNRDLEKHPEKRELRIRKWLTYITLFISAITIIVDLVELVFNLLEGDFTVRFLLKVLAVFIVAGMVFKYYYFELRREAGKWAPHRGIFRYSSLILVLASVIGAFFIVGSPLTNRQRGYDSQRLNDLQNIQYQVVNYWQQRQTLPTALTDLNDPISSYAVPVDPETGAPYEYQSLKDKSFELCATFSLASTQNNGNASYPVTAAPMPAPVGKTVAPGTPETWQHDAGHTCFSRTIDPLRYPPYPTK